MDDVETKFHQMTWILGLLISKWSHFYRKYKDFELFKPGRLNGRSAGEDFVDRFHDFHDFNKGYGPF